ncbi:hypothetical protein KR222_000160 [Zaprionus bogoriensis]|nr:hypothetical protein KR222_000160 [Zaprionus bogoriensis]
MQAKSSVDDTTESSVRLLKIPRAAPQIEEYGFRLSRSKWDPYPWVSEVAAGTPAALCGLKTGDCILKVNDIDILGMRIVKVAQIVKRQEDGVTFLCWRSDCEIDCDESSICCVPMPTSLRRLVIIVDSILKVIECPVCTATICPPVMQCQNGHLLCLDCRIRSEKCPICRGYFTPIRSSVAEEIYLIISGAFEHFRNEGKLRHKIFGNLALTKASGSDAWPCRGGGAARQRKPLLPTNKILNKLLQCKAESLENLFHCNSAKLLRAEPTGGFNVMTVEHANEKRLQPELTRPSMAKSTTGGEGKPCTGSDSHGADSLEQQDVGRGKSRAGGICSREPEVSAEPRDGQRGTPIAATAPKSVVNELWTTAQPVKAPSNPLATLLLLH